MNQNIGLFGSRAQGSDVRQGNITAVMAVSNIIKSSLGPQGLDKMLVDEIGDITITNDGATILRQLEVEHPAGRVLVDLSQLQDKEVGDGTTSVVIIAAELLRRAYELYKNKLHPSNIINGYRIACKEAVKFIKENMAININSASNKDLINIAKTSMSSKLISGEMDLFGKIVIDCLEAVKTKSGKFPINNVKIIKNHGKSTLESYIFPGYILKSARVSQQMNTYIKDAKIAFLDMNLSKFRLKMGYQINVEDPKNLEKIRQREIDILKDRLTKIIDSGANVILTTLGIDDIASKYMVERGVMAFRRVEKSELKRIARATGGSVVTTLATGEGEEEFEASNLGYAEEVYEESIGDWDYVYIKNRPDSDHKVATIVLRGANEYMLDEIDRSVHDSLCAIKRTIESKYVVVGGGCVEVALNVYLEKYLTQISSLEHMAILEFAEALLVIPKQLTINAAKDPTDLVSKLIGLHNANQSDSLNEKYKNLIHSGLDLKEGKLRNNYEAGVLEPLVSKIKSLKYATEAAISILRIDDMIKISPEQEKIPQRR